MTILTSDSGIGPIFTWPAQSLTINQRPSLAARVVGRNLIYTDRADGIRKVRDYRQRIGYPVTPGITTGVVPGVLNGVSALTLTQGDYIDLGAVFPTGGAAYTIAVVGRLTDVTHPAALGGAALVSSALVGGGWNDFRLVPSGNGDGLFRPTIAHRGALMDGDSGTPIDPTTPFLLVARMALDANGNQSFDIRLNGSEYSSHTIVNDANHQWNDAHVYIGRLLNYPNQFPFIGQLPEVVIYNSKLADADVAADETYYLSAYGIA